jgi:pimeloyl-ACP methyl ester carboxylesterase
VPSVAIAAALAAVALLATGAAVAEPIETFVEAPGPLAPLKGTLLTPADNPHAPVVLIIPGSGPTDRDGDNPMGVRAAPYRLLAEALAADGIASARIDKRGMFASGPAVKNGDQVTIGDYASDVHAWVASLKAKTGARCIWVLGHSEGALVAEAAAQRPEGICGIILVSGMGRRFGDVITQQLKDNPANAPILAEALAASTACPHNLLANYNQCELIEDNREDRSPSCSCSRRAQPSPSWGRSAKWASNSSPLSRCSLWRARMDRTDVSSCTSSTRTIRGNSTSARVLMAAE